MSNDLKRARDDFSAEELFVRPNWWEKVKFAENTPDENTKLYQKGLEFWKNMKCPLCAGAITVDKNFQTPRGATEPQQIHELFCDRCVVGDKFGKDEPVKFTKRYKKILYPELPDEVKAHLNPNDPALSLLRRTPEKVVFPTKLEKALQEERERSQSEMAELRQQLLHLSEALSQSGSVKDSHTKLARLTANG